MIRVKLSIPEVDSPIFDDEVTLDNLKEFEKKFDEMNVYDTFKGYKDRIRNEVMNDDGFYDKEYDITRNSFRGKMVTKLDEDEITQKDKEFLKQCKDSKLFKNAPKEVLDYLNSLDAVEEPKKLDPNEEISFWITYHATFLTELYSPEFFKRNPQEVIDDIDDLSMKVTLTREQVKTADNPYKMLKEAGVKAMLTTLNIDPESLGEEFKDSFLAKTGIIYMDIIGIDLTRAMQEKYAGCDDDIDSFMVGAYKGIEEDTDLITYRNIVELIK